MEEALKPIDFPADIDGFTFVEYLTMFSSLIFAFAASEYFVSIGKMIKSWSRIKFYWEYVFWVIVTFFMLISYWYINWLRLSYISHSIVSFFLLVMPTFILFIIVSVFFPEFDSEKSYNLKTHFKKIINKVIILFAVYLGFNLLVDILNPTEGQNHALVTQALFLGIATFHVFYPKQWIRLIMLLLFSIQIIFVFIHI